MMFVIMVVSALWAPQIAKFDGLFRYIQEMLAYMVPPVTVLFLLGVFWRAGTAKGALTTLVGGHAVAVFLFLADKGFLSGGEPLWGTPIHFTLVAGLVFGASLLIYVATAHWGVTKTDDELRHAETPRLERALEEVDAIIAQAREMEPALEGYAPGGLWDVHRKVLNAERSKSTSGFHDDKNLLHKSPFVMMLLAKRIKFHH